MKILITPIIRYLLLAACCLLLCNFLLAQSTFTITITPNNATCSTDKNGSASVSVSGGNPPYTYKWSPGGKTTSSITGLSPGTYSVTIKDNTPGEDSTLGVFVGPKPIVITFQDNPPICINTIGSITVTSSGGTGAHKYLWSTGDTLQTIDNLTAGTYSIQVTDANDCTATASEDLRQGDCEPSAELWFTPNGDGYNDTWLIANSEFFPNAEVIVFDRWGVTVHQQKGLYVPWDGKGLFGLHVPDAVYYYFFFKDKSDGQKKALKGSVIIMR